MYKLYRKKCIIPMKPYVDGMNLTGVSVSSRDTPGEGGMVVVNPREPRDIWYISKEYFEENYEEIS